MFTNDDLVKAHAAAAKLEEAKLFLTALQIVGWKGQAATAAGNTRAAHLTEIYEGIEQVGELIYLLKEREKLRNLLAGVH